MIGGQSDETNPFDIGVKSPFKDGPRLIQRQSVAFVEPPRCESVELLGVLLCTTVCIQYVFSCSPHTTIRRGGWEMGGVCGGEGGDNGHFASRAILNYLRVSVLCTVSASHVHFSSHVSL